MAVLLPDNPLPPLPQSILLSPFSQPPPISAFCPSPAHLRPCCASPLPRPLFASHRSPVPAINASAFEQVAVPDSDMKDIWYAAQYARTAERAAQLSVQVGDLQHRLVQSQALGEDAAFDAPPAVPSDEDEEEDADASGTFVFA